jgi:hypothetical protein
MLISPPMSDKLEFDKSAKVLPIDKANLAIPISTTLLLTAWKRVDSDRSRLPPR